MFAMRGRERYGDMLNQSFSALRSSCNNSIEFDTKHLTKQILFDRRLIQQFFVIGVLVGGRQFAEWYRTGYGRPPTLPTKVSRAKYSRCLWSDHIAGSGKPPIYAEDN